VEVNADRDECDGERQQRRANQQPAKRFHSWRDSPGRRDRLPDCAGYQTPTDHHGIPG